QREADQRGSRPSEIEAYREQTDESRGRRDPEVCLAPPEDQHQEGDTHGGCRRHRIGARPSESSLAEFLLRWVSNEKPKHTQHGDYLHGEAEGAEDECPSHSPVRAAYAYCQGRKKGDHQQLE